MNFPVVEKAGAVSAAELLARYTVPNYGRLALVPARGEGTLLWDETGRQYLDFGGGVAVTSLGHCPPAITKALAGQGSKLIHCSNWYQIREQGELGKFITETVMEHPGKSVFCNSVRKPTKRSSSSPGNSATLPVWQMAPRAPGSLLLITVSMAAPTPGSRLLVRKK